jgi:hypothetical protein
MPAMVKAGAAESEGTGLATRPARAKRIRATMERWFTNDTPWIGLICKGKSSGPICD